MIKEGNIFEVNNLYETSFPKLTEQYYKVTKKLSSWIVNKTINPICYIPLVMFFSNYPIHYTATSTNYIEQS